MIKKVIKIIKDTKAEDFVSLSWFDMQKPNLTAISQKGVEFILKTKYTHLHENDVLKCEDGYKIEVKKSEDSLFVIEFKDHITFAKIAYEIGNRHQPIAIEDYKITILDDISTADIVNFCETSSYIEVTKQKGIFKPNGKAHHSH